MLSERCARNILTNPAAQEQKFLTREACRLLVVHRQSLSTDRFWMLHQARNANIHQHDITRVKHNKSGSKATISFLANFFVIYVALCGPSSANYALLLWFRMLIESRGNASSESGSRYCHRKGPSDVQICGVPPPLQMMFKTTSSFKSEWTLEVWELLDASPGCLPLIGNAWTMISNRRKAIPDKIKNRELRFFGSARFASIFSAYGTPNRRRNRDVPNNRNLRFLIFKKRNLRFSNKVKHRKLRFLFAWIVEHRVQIPSGRTAEPLA